MAVFLLLFIIFVLLFCIVAFSQLVEKLIILLWRLLIIAIADLVFFFFALLFLLNVNIVLALMISIITFFILYRLFSAEKTELRESEIGYNFKKHEKTPRSGGRSQVPITKK